MQAAAPDKSTEKGVVGRNIVLARQHLGISQGELARRLRIDRRQLSEWERGLWDPSLRKLRPIAVALGRPMEWFLDLHDTA
jgi:transcriptional regulator with XRE-family HTH domain